MPFFLKGQTKLLKNNQHFSKAERAKLQSDKLAV